MYQRGQLQMTVAASLLSTFPLTAVAQSIGSSDTKVVIVDARSGIVTGRLDLGTGDRVQVRVTNINPYLYQYRFVDKERVTYNESAITAFAKLAFGFVVPDKSLTISSAITPAARKEISATVSGSTLCAEGIDTVRTRANAQALGIAKRVLQLADDHGVLAASLDGFATASRRLLNNTKGPRTTMQSANVEALEIRAAARMVVDSFGVFLESHAKDTLDLPARATAVRVETQALSTSLDGLASRYPACAFPLFRALVANIASDTAAHAAHIANARRFIRTSAEFVDGAIAANSDTLRFESSRWFGPYDDPSRVTLEIQRLPVGTDTLWRSVAAPVLRLGGRRQFGVLIGTLSAKISTSEYATVREYARPPAAVSDTVVNVVRKVGSRDWLVTPMVGLSTRMLYIGTPAVALHSVFGVGATVGDGKATATYHGGLAISFANERVFLSGGLTSALGKGLAQGATANTAVPASQSTVPVVEARINRVGLALLYRAF